MGQPVTGIEIDSVFDLYFQWKMAVAENEKVDGAVLPQVVLDVVQHDVFVVLVKNLPAGLLPARMGAFAGDSKSPTRR